MIKNMISFILSNRKTTLCKITNLQDCLRFHGLRWIKRLSPNFRPIVRRIFGGWWHHRQTEKAPVDLRICGGFPISVDGCVDGFFGDALFRNIWESFPLENYQEI